MICLSRIKGFAAVALACACAILPARAENYPYRSDLLWVTVPDHADWLYDTGEDPSIEVQLYRYGVPCDGVCVDYEIGEDMMPSDRRGSVTLKDGKAKIRLGSMAMPGFRDCRLSVVFGGKKYDHHVKVGFSPERLVPYTEDPSDFDEFWSAAKADLAKVPIEYTVEPEPRYTTDKIECRLIRLKVSRQGQVVYGYLFIPKGVPDGSCPIVVTPPGAGIKTIKEPMRHKYYAENGCIRFEMEIHGLNPGMSDEQFSEIGKAFGGRENGYLQNGLDNRDNYYMKRVYLSLVRVVDMLVELPQWDGRNVIMQGGSQGGALAIVGAALDSRVTACVANHPALSDMARYLSGHAGGYPHFFRVAGMDTPDKIRTMSYYDVVNFARRLTVPAFLTWGYNDNTCPPTTSYIVYNAIRSYKEALITPINEHWTSDETDRRQMEWILQHLR